MGYITTKDFSLLVGTVPVTVPLQFPGLGASSSATAPSLSVAMRPGEPGANPADKPVEMPQKNTPHSPGQGPAEVDPSAKYMSITNTSPPGGPTIWLSRAGVAAINGAGSYPLAPGQAQTFEAPQNIPTNPLSVVATAADAPLTIEIAKLARPRRSEWQTGTT